MYVFFIIICQLVLRVCGGGGLFLCLLVVIFNTEGFEFYQWNKDYFENLQEYKENIKLERCKLLYPVPCVFQVYFPSTNMATNSVGRNKGEFPIISIVICKSQFLTLYMNLSKRLGTSRKIITKSEYVIKFLKYCAEVINLHAFVSLLTPNWGKEMTFIFLQQIQLNKLTSGLILQCKSH